MYERTLSTLELISGHVRAVQASAGRTKMYVLKCKVKPAGTHRAALALLSAPASSPSIDADGARKVRLQTELLTRL